MGGKLHFRIGVLLGGVSVGCPLLGSGLFGDGLSGGVVSLESLLKRWS